MRKYVGNLMQGDGRYWSKDVIATVVANTEQEALGMFLEYYPNSKGDEWTIYGGDTNVGYGEVDELSISGWEA